MHVDHVAVVRINIEQFVFSQVRHTHVIIVGNVFMGQNHIWLVPFIAWCLHVSDTHVFVDLVLVYLKEEILFCNHFMVRIRSQVFTIDLGLKVNKGQLLLNDSVDLFLDLLNGRVIMLVYSHWFESRPFNMLLLQICKVRHLL